jgi:hypothetical protein
MADFMDQYTAVEFKKFIVFGGLGIDEPWTAQQP